MSKPAISTIPAISVIMGVYNGAEYIEECISSILNQTFTDFEFIIVDDASTDDAPQILARLASEDSRIRILTNDENMNIPFTFNKAIHAAKAPYVAIMDSDDWSYPERLAKQYAFMEANPSVSLCATQAEIYETSKPFPTRPCDNISIRAYLFFNCYLHHPTVMLRKAPVMERSQGYDVNMPMAQDYDLWTRLAEHDDIVFASLPDILFRYRIHKGKARTQHFAIIEETSSKVRLRLQQQLGVQEPSVAMHVMLGETKRTKDPQKLHECGKWMQEILKLNEQTSHYDIQAFRNEANAHWAKLCYRCLPSMLQAASIYKQYSPKRNSLYTEIAKALLTTNSKRFRAMKTRFKRRFSNNSYSHS